MRAPLGLNGRDVPVPSHICLFYRDDAELRERLRFLTLGLEDPSQASVVFGKFDRLATVLGYLAEDSGRDIEADIASGRLVLIDGLSTGDATLAQIGATLDRLVAEGVTLIRFLGFIAWGDESWPPEDDLLAFEAKVNAAVMNYPAIIMCSYRIDALSGPIIIQGGIETHPLTLLGSRFCENPHYIPPEEYLVRLRDAGSRVATAAPTGIPLAALSAAELDRIAQTALDRSRTDR